MEATYNDPAFGVMTYKHRWYKQHKVALFNSDFDIVVAAKAYSGKEITKAQQESYKLYFDNEDKFASEIAEALKEYINLNLQELAAYWIGARSVDKASDLIDMVMPKTLLFKQDGSTIMLLNCKWDEEHGIAVQIFPSISVGSQDLFL